MHWASSTQTSETRASLPFIFLKRALSSRSRTQVGDGVKNTDGVSEEANMDFGCVTSIILPNPGLTMQPLRTARCAREAG